MESSADPWHKRAVAAWAFGASASGFLFALTALPFLAILFRIGQRSVPVYSFACFPLASAGLMLTLVAAIVPDLVAGAKMRFPLNLTLPSLYSGLVAVSSLVMSSFMPPIALIGDAPRFDQVWGRLDFIGSAWLSQVAGTTIWVLLSKRREGTSE